MTGAGVTTGAAPAAGSGPVLSGVPARVGVLGGGRMGAGIAHAFVLAGADVRIVERDEEAADAASARLRASLAKAVERGSTARSAD